MDDIDRKISILLAEDARRSLADIGSVVGLSASAVNERIRRIAVSRVIRRFTVDADPAAFGKPVLAFVWIALSPEADEAAFRDYAKSQITIAECHHVTGPWSYIIKVHVGSLADLEAFLSELKTQKFIVRSETVIALSSVVDGPFHPRET
ncbi:MAG: AsnC family transcriptional regulator [Pelagibacterium sp. SCN 64-44]|nr:MAG: AsnC family transcriptional regulator [Pelagibacterium sp. SCN 64-44]